MISTDQLIVGSSICLIFAINQAQIAPQSLPKPSRDPIINGSTILRTVEYAFYSPMETEFELGTAWKWMEERRHWPAVISAVYLLLLAFCQGSVVDFESRFKLNKPVNWPRFRTAWNSALAIFSAIGFSRLAPPLIETIYSNGMIFTMCSTLDFLGTGAPGFWAWLFPLSKVFELGDTVLLLLHGKQLSFLHVYHHSTVLIWSWHQYVEASVPSFIFATMNLFVHTIMYAYFAIVEWRGSAKMRTTAAFITSIQSLQMVLGVVVSLTAGFTGLYGTGTSAICDTDLPCPCRFTAQSSLFSAVMYAGYLILFLNFANKAYALELRCLILFRYVTSKIKHGYVKIYKSGVAHKDGSSIEEMEEDIERRPWTKQSLNREQKFEAACKSIPFYMAHIKPEEGLKLYGMYKQVEVGNISSTGLTTSKIAKEKGFHDLKSLASSGLDRSVMKSAAWAMYMGEDTAKCMVSYVSLVNALSLRATENNNNISPAHSIKAKKLLSSNTVSPSKSGEFYKVRITGIGRYLPKRIQTTEEIEVKGGFAPGDLTKQRTGVLERRRCGPDETLTKMGAAAALEALKESGLNPEDLDVIINASGTQEQPVPDGSTRLQRELGLGDSGIECFSVHSTCLSFMVAMEMAAGLLMRPNGKTQRVLISSSESTKEVINPYDAHSAPLFGDGAGAIVLIRSLDSSSKDSESCIEAYQMHTFSAGHNLTQFAGSGLLNRPYVSIDEKMDPRTPNPEFRFETNHFQMDGPETVKFVAPLLPTCLNLLRDGLSSGLGDIDWVVPHQASGLALDALSIFNWPQGRIIRTLPKLGNCMAASLPMTLYEGVKSGKIKRGQRVLMCGSGAGLSIAGMILVY